MKITDRGLLDRMAEIGREMVAQDNHGTMCPVWVVEREGKEKYPRQFLTEQAAKEYIAENAHSVAGVKVVSVWDNREMLTLMKACLLAAGVANRNQALNAYDTAIREG